MLDKIKELLSQLKESADRSESSSDVKWVVEYTKPLCVHLRAEKRNAFFSNDTPSIVSEAVIAAIYLDGGIEPARKHILRFIVPEIKHQSRKPFKDYKTTLQEIVQKNPGEKIEYILASESGPDHDKHFVYEVHLNTNVIGKGGGRSKREAEQQAAHEALKLLGY